MFNQKRKFQKKKKKKKNSLRRQHVKQGLGAKYSLNKNKHTIWSERVGDWGVGCRYVSSEIFWGNFFLIFLQIMNKCNLL